MTKAPVRTGAFLIRHSGIPAFRRPAPRVGALGSGSASDPGNRNGLGVFLPPLCQNAAAMSDPQSGSAEPPASPVDEDLLHSLVGDTPTLSPLETLRHSTAHVMAKAVQRLFPGTKVTIGPSIDTGFYYDFDRAHAVHRRRPREDRGRDARKIIKANEPFERHEKSSAMRCKARCSRQLGETYKVELIDSLPARGRHGQLLHHRRLATICVAAPHVAARPARSRRDQAAQRRRRLLARRREATRSSSASTAPRSRPRPSSTTLPEAMHRGGQAPRSPSHRQGPRPVLDRRDHRRAAWCLWHPKGARIRHLIETFWREEHFAQRLRAGGRRRTSPAIDLWKTSGHLSFYKENDVLGHGHRRPAVHGASR